MTWCQSGCAVSALDLGPWCDLGEGALILNAGNLAPAALHFVRAVEGSDHLKVPFEAARTRIWLAKVAEPAAARAEMAAAKATFVTLEAKPLSTETDRRLAVLDSVGN